MAKSKNPITNDADLNSTPCLLSVAGLNFGKKNGLKLGNQGFKILSFRSGCLVCLQKRNDEREFESNLP